MRAVIGVCGETAGAPRCEHPDHAVAAAARPDGLSDNIADRRPRPRQRQMKGLRGAFEAIQVGLQVVDIAALERLEHAVASVDHVVVDRDHHERRLRRDGVDQAGIHGIVPVVEGLAGGPQGLGKLGCAQAIHRARE